MIDLSKELIIPSNPRKTLERSGYLTFGRHSAIKPCYWLKSSLKSGKKCYKSWYGISSHRCIQMSPAAVFCSQKCIFCWRPQGRELSKDWVDFNPFRIDLSSVDVDDPSFIADMSIKLHLKLVENYRRSRFVDPVKLKEALKPKHVAISLSGEPTIYPFIGELIHEYRVRGLTTFLVTNGTFPEKLSKLSCEPSQLYVSLVAPNEEVYRLIARPASKLGWRKLNETLEILGSFSCPTVLRLTLLRNYNMKEPEGYAKLISKANPTYVEPKAAMYMGYARGRVKAREMPRFEEIRFFAAQVSDLTGYKILAESIDSRVVLLSKLKEPLKVGA